MGAIDEHERLTDVGRKLSRLPVDPRVGRMILAADEEHCLREVLIIAAALELQDPRERPVDKQQAADECHQQFVHEDSDFLSYLKLWDFYDRLKHDLSRSRLRKACQQNFLSYNRMREWQEIHRQLLQIVEQNKLKQQPRRDDYDAIHRALLTGLLSGIAYRSDTYEYTGAGGQKLHLWPGSGTFGQKPKWIVAAELVETSRRYARVVARINPNWIEPLAEHLVSREHNDPHWVPETGSVMAYEKVTLFGLPIVPRRRIPYGRVNAPAAREMFIQQGLVEGDWQTSMKFFTHNRQLFEQLEEMAAKTRRRDFLLGEEARYEFYDRRIPADVYDGARLRKWLRKAEQTDPRILHMAEADLVADQSDTIAAADFPDAITVAEMRLPLEYHLEPGSAEDGVTLTVPQAALNQLDPHRLEWLVPGLVEEKVLALLKSLPKSTRRSLNPLAETAQNVAAALPFANGPFSAAVAEPLAQITGTRFDPAEFRHVELPNHLRMNVRVVDADGETLGEGRDLTQIRKTLGAAAAATFSAVDDPRWNRDGIVQWDFGELPKRIDIQRGGVALKGYPALIDTGEAASLRLLDCPLKATFETRSGLRRLFSLAERRELKAQADWLPNIDRILLNAATLPDAANFRQQIAELIADRAFLSTGNIPRSAEEFDQQRRTGNQRMGRAVQEVAALLEPMLANYQKALVAVESAGGKGWDDAVADMRQQLQELTEPGFLTRTPWNWLQQYPRYLDGIRRRLQKLSAGGLPRDKQHQSVIRPRWKAYHTRAAEHRSRGVYDPEIIQYRWMLEELRISLFVQELGTSISISPQRLDKQGAKVRA